MAQKNIRIIFARKTDFRERALYESPSDSERKDLELPARLPDSEIDYSDVPALQAVPAQVFVGRFIQADKKGRLVFGSMRMCLPGSVRGVKGTKAS